MRTIEEVVDILSRDLSDAKWKNISLEYVSYGKLLSEILEIHKAEQKPKGKWIHWTDDYKDYCTCSKCGYGEEGELLLKNITPFCPYCGSYNGGREDAD